MKRFLLCGVLLALLAGCGTAGEQLPEEVPEDPGNPPGVGGADEDPGLRRGQVGCAAAAEVRCGVLCRVAQALRQKPGAVAAVAGAGKVDDHNNTPVVGS